MATLRTQLTLSAFVSLGAAPVYIENKGYDPIFFIIDTVAPVVPGGTDIADLPQHSIEAGGAENITLTGTVYARGSGAVTFSR